MRIEVRDKNNLLIGWINDVGDRLVGTHIKKGYVGQYVKSSNLTLDKSGRIYCYGDGLQSIIREVENGN